MTRIFLLTTLLLSAAITASAQDDDDMYFTPKKSTVERITPAAKQSVETYEGAIVGQTEAETERDVDEYNRRGYLSSSYEPLEGDTLYDDVFEFCAGDGTYETLSAADTLPDYDSSMDYIDDDDYQCTRILVLYDDWYGPYWHGYYGWGWAHSYYGWYYDPWYWGWYGSPYWYGHYGWGWSWPVHYAWGGRYGGHHPGHWGSVRTTNHSHGGHGGGSTLASLGHGGVRTSGIGASSRAPQHGKTASSVRQNGSKQSGRSVTSSGRGKVSGTPSSTRSGTSMQRSAGSSSRPATSSGSSRSSFSSGGSRGSFSSGGSRGGFGGGTRSGGGHGGGGRH